VRRFGFGTWALAARVNLLTVGRTGRVTSSLRLLCQPSARGEIFRSALSRRNQQQEHPCAAKLDTSCARLTNRSPGTAALGVCIVNGQLAVPDKTPCAAASARDLRG